VCGSPTPVWRRARQRVFHANDEDLSLGWETGANSSSGRDAKVEALDFADDGAITHDGAKSDETYINESSVE
jgi:hypothetical protein